MSVNPHPARDLTRREIALVAAVLLVGVLARLVLAGHGYNHVSGKDHNYDVDSWWIVASIVEHGGNVYAETSRYTTGPVWFLLLGWVKHLPPVSIDPFYSFRLEVSALLTLVDVGLGLVLLSRHGLTTMALFMLNPISIFISGYHAQFDNLAVLVGLVGILLMERAGRQRRGAVLLGLCILGLSLAIKHILFVLPIWLAVGQRSWRMRALAILVPYGLFVLSLAPYWAVGGRGIVDHVFLYRSFDNGPVWSILGGLTNHRLPAFGLFVVAMLFLGLWWRRRPIYELTLLYLVAVVVLSSATANQYLAIPAVTCAVYPNGLFVGYTLLGAAHLVGSREGFGIGQFRPGDESVAGSAILGFPVLIGLLGGGLAWAIWRNRAARQTEKAAPPSGC